MNYLIELVNFVFAYCTDFIINLSNIFELSYYEIYSYPQKSDSKLNKFFYTKFAVYDKEKINISI